MEDTKARMRELIETLDQAGKAYYAQGHEIMSNLEYDALYDELVQLEEESGMVLAGSPTQQVGYEVLSDLPKETHPAKMLSLSKTKSREELAAWLGDQKGLLSWKLDGLTIVLTYENGTLSKAVTRGNGVVGEVITPNAKTFVNLPLQIGFPGQLVLRGEAVISYADFEAINKEIPGADAKYKNPRNLCAGSVRQLNSQVTAGRHVQFYAFSLVSAEGVDFGGSREMQMQWLAGQGFDTVEYQVVTQQTILPAVEDFAKRVQSQPIPSDGLVLLYDDMVYSASLGATAKYPRDAMAFKWQDQTAETVLRDMEWSASRTGLINPVAIFDPVELEGTTVSRASVHNVSIVRELKLAIGDTIEVYKANMIIPQIARNLTESGGLPIPTVCPVCGEATLLKNDNGVETLVCPAPDCLAKQIKQFTLFVSRDAMNMDGLSEATIEKLIGQGLIRELADLFKASQWHDAIVEMEGFGEKSFANLTASIEAARHTTPQRLLYALGIPGFGTATAASVARACGGSWEKMRHLTKEELLQIDGIGEILAQDYVAFFAGPDKARIVDDLMAVLELDETQEERETFLEGLTFVITGSLHGYENRDALKAAIEQAGGKVAGSVSAKTSYLINNDVTSTSGKNKKAQELGVPIIPEDTITRWLAQKGVA